ncbi:MAG: DNA-3-methyladenine glycosylase [Patescibacteria group bacterium]
MARVLGEKFFMRSADRVAPDLLGKILVRQRGGETKRYRIIETEAYEGPLDKASHASRGRTARTEVMFGPPGRWYVYFIYGMYEMLNIVTGPKDHPGAVLIRAVKIDHTLVDGPGKLTKELRITRALNAKKAVPENGVWIEDAKPVVEKGIERTPRIGVAYAEEWAKKPWRFVLKY